MQLGISVLLRTLESLGEVFIFDSHLCQNVVRRSVQDTGHGIDLVRCKGIVKCMDDRNSAAAACLKEIVDVVGFRYIAQLQSMLRNQLLVGCAYALTGFESLLGKHVCRAKTSHCLHDNLDLRIAQDVIVVMCQDFLSRIARELAQIENILNIDLLACPSGNSFPVHIENAVNTCSYCTIP